MSARKFLIIPDLVEEGGIIDAQHIHFAENDDGKEVQIRKVSSKWPTATVLVYSLTEMAKLKEKPKYQRYTVSEKGEVVPV